MGELIQVSEVKYSEKRLDVPIIVSKTFQCKKCGLASLKDLDNNRLILVPYLRKN